MLEPSKLTQPCNLTTHFLPSPQTIVAAARLQALTRARHRRPSRCSSCKRSWRPRRWFLRGPGWASPASRPAPTSGVRGASALARRLHFFWLKLFTCRLLEASFSPAHLLEAKCSPAYILSVFGGTAWRPRVCRARCARALMKCTSIRDMISFREVRTCCKAFP